MMLLQDPLVWGNATTLGGNRVLDEKFRDDEGDRGKFSWNWGNILLIRLYEDSQVTFRIGER